jgi:DNA polymerase elongation subunit (family B)
MLNKQLNEIIFLDIETVPQAAEYSLLPEEMQDLWSEKATRLYQDKSSEESYEKAGIYAEFGKIVCISVGFVYLKDKEKHIRLKSFTSDDERELLTDFAQMLRKQKSNICLCGHNIKEFDVPYIARRMLINGLHLPTVLNIAGKKPWEVNFIDTLDLWKFGDYKHYSSLKLLTAIFAIPTPKDDIDGSQVATVYYQEKNLARIAAYCQKDVLATAQLFLKMQGESLINAECIEYV